MDNQNTEAHDLILKARDALRRGDKETAHNLGEQAALLAPGMEDAWLILTASDPNPEDALAYAQQALEINPSSERALKAVEWAIARLKQAQTAPAAVVAAAPGAPAPVPAEPEKPQETKKSNTRTWIYVGAALILLLCLVAVFAAYREATSPTFASLIKSAGLNKVTEPTQVPANHWARMSLPKPSGAPSQNGDSSQPAAATPTAASSQDRPTNVPASKPTAAPTSVPSEAPSGAATATSQSSDSLQAADASQSSGTTQAAGASQTANTTQAAGASQTANTTQAAGASQTTDMTQAADAPQTADTTQAADASQTAGTTQAAAAPQAADTAQAAGTQQGNEAPVVMNMEMVADTPAPVNQPAPSSAPLPAAATDGSGARWIDVDLTHQMVYAYVGDSVVNSFLVSTGTWLHPTVVGQYHIYVKYRSAPMSGPGYYLPDVPYIMYFYGDYGLHGTYWHSNFGTPMSHGCVNLRTDQAAWLYSWASVGTLVNIHY